jgi:L-lactate dehydrogenase complex protein LldF
MSDVYNKFQSDSEIKAFDLQHRKTINYNIGKYNEAVLRGKKQYRNLEMARRQAAFKKYRAIENLENSLRDFESNFTKRGGKVIWARDAEEACNEILKILRENNVKLVVKSKSMVTEELDLDEFLAKNGIESIETDLGEYIVQISGDKPYHIVTPVMHKSAKEIAEIFNRKFDLPPDSTPEEITKFVRGILRSKFENAQAGITGANFLVSSSGSVALTENEGNGVMSACLPPLHIAVAGIEKVIQNLEDLHLFWPLLATFGTGQNITAYNSIISGPKQKNETTGPEKMYVVLLDNGRTRLLSRIPQRRALSCIRCGSCLNACPIYRNVGGHTYGSVYSGPIGAVITPHLKSMEDYKHLSYASSLCGKCTEVCPVNIDLHVQLLENRHYAVKNNMVEKPEKRAISGWKKAMLNPWMIDIVPSKLKNYFLKTILKKTWGNRREIPEIQPRSFRKLWNKSGGKLF